MFTGGSLVCWYSGKQKRNTAQSSCEAEYYAAVSAANIAKIAATQFNSGGGGGGQAPSIPQASSTSTTAATPNVSLFGQGNDLNNVSAPQEAQQTQITVKAVVSETEITNTQQKIDKINQNATL